MSLLSYTELCELVEQGVITDVKPEAINAASIDVRLGSKIIIERYNDHRLQIVDLAKRGMWAHHEINIDGTIYDLMPQEFILAQTMETFNLPNDICAEFKLKSSGARAGLENSLATWCVVGDTEIATLDGGAVKIKDLVGTEGVWVYAVNSDGKVVPAKSSPSWITKYVSETVRVTLDNGSHFECTPDHKVMLRTGAYIEAQALDSGAALMPFNRRLNPEGREEVYTFNRGKEGQHAGRWIQTHRMVGEEVLGGVPDGYCVHHKDFGLRDNRPENLEVIPSAKHIGIHATVRNAKHAESISRRASARLKAMWADPEWAAKKNALSSEAMRKANEMRWKDPDHRAKMLPIQTRLARENFSKTPKHVLQNAAKLGMVRSAIKAIVNAGETVCETTYAKRKRQNAPTVETLTSTFGSFTAALSLAGYENHKIISVERITHSTPIPVYDLTVPDHHNFAIACGAFVHNCDCGWNGSVLTLELKNMLRYHTLRLTPGMYVGQMIFYRVKEVPKERSYATIGRYNGDQGVQAVKK